MTCHVMIGAVSSASVIAMVCLALAMLVPMLMGMVFFRKNIVGRILLFGLLAGMIWAVETWWLTDRQPDVSTTLAVRQINGGSAAAADVRIFDAGKNAVHVIRSPGNFVGGVAVFWRPCQTRSAQVERPPVQSGNDCDWHALRAWFDGLHEAVRSTGVCRDRHFGNRVPDSFGRGWHATGAVSIRRLSEAAQDRDQARADSASLVAGRAHCPTMGDGFQPCGWSR